jgi:hypothetical protein
MSEAANSDDHTRMTGSPNKCTTSGDRQGIMHAYYHHAELDDMRITATVAKPTLNHAYSVLGIM